MIEAGFRKIKEPCGCIFALKTDAKGSKIVWVYVNPNCTLEIHHVKAN